MLAWAASGSFLCDIHLLYSHRKNSRKTLWSLCRNWGTWRRNLDILSDTSRWAPFLFSYRKFKHVFFFMLMKAWWTWVQLYALQHSTDATVEESERIFSRLIRLIEKQSCEVKELIRVQEKAAVSHAEELLEKIQRETAAFRRVDADLEKLSRTDDHILFLQVEN